MIGPALALLFGALVQVDAGAALASPDNPSATPFRGHDRPTPEELAEAELDLGAVGAQVTRDREALALLQALMSDVPVGESRLEIVPVDELGRTFELRAWTIRVDGDVVFGDQGVAPPSGVAVWRGPLPPGPHEVEVEARIHGRSRGPFTYVNAYAFTVRASERLELGPGQAGTLRIAASTRGRGALAWEDRPQVELELSVAEPEPAADEATAPAL